MNTKSFFETYKLEEVDVREIKGTKEGLSIILDLNSYMWFIGNGFRSEFDEAYTHEFIFLGVKSDLKLTNIKQIKNYRYQNDVLSFIADGTLVEIPFTEIKINQNC